MLVGEKIVESAGLNFLTVISFSDLAVTLLILFVAMGLGVGVIGSLMAIKKFLKV